MDAEKNWRFCVVANIVRERIGEDGNTYYGTKEFKGGTRIYLYGTYEGIPGYTTVLGLNRFGKYEIAMIPQSCIENVRVQRIYNKTVLEIIDHEARNEGAVWWGSKASDRKEAKAFADMIKERAGINSEEL